MIQLKNEFNAAVLGGGPGGYVAAIRCSQLGLKTVIIEERELGGTCLNRGCIPTKALLHSAEVYKTALEAAEFGVSTGEVSFDYSKFAARKDSVVSRLRRGIAGLMKSYGIEVVSGRGAVKNRNAIQVGEREITFDKLILATGSRPMRPPIPGIDGKNVVTSDEVLSFDECPESVVIIGGGVIGIEFATLFSTLGRKVTVIEMLDRILPPVDAEIAAAMHGLLEKSGVEIFTGAKVVEINGGDTVSVTYEKDGGSFKAEGATCIVCIGRRPNTEDIGLEAVGVQMQRGFITVEDNMETTVPGIYAIGDITGKLQLAHVADAQGLVAAASAAGQKAKMHYNALPSCIYTEPEIASIGLSEEEARKTHEIKIGTFSPAGNGKSMVMGQSEGLVKIITDADSGEILGAHIMAARATDMIAEIGVAMKLESTIEELADTVHPHPTVSEMIMEAAHDVDGLCCHKPKKK